MMSVSAGPTPEPEQAIPAGVWDRVTWRYAAASEQRHQPDDPNGCCALCLPARAVTWPCTAAKDAQAAKRAAGDTSPSATTPRPGRVYQSRHATVSPRYPEPSGRLVTAGHSRG